MEANKSLMKFPLTRLRAGMAQIGLILAVLFVIARFNYLLFHVLSEFFVAAISLAIFLLAWNARKFTKNNYYLFFGAAFLTSGAISLIHALTYRGMGVVAGTANDSNTATQLWLANQFILAATFFAAPFLLRKKMELQSLLLIYSAVFAFFLTTIFYWKIFPVAYAEGIGLTPFKKTSEYVVAAFFLISLYFFWKRRSLITKRFFQLVSFTIILFFISTILFTLYVGVYSFPNELGHLLRVMAYYASYLALVELGLMRPYHSIFKDLKDKELELKKAADEWIMTFNSISDPIFILDVNHTIVKVNRALLEFLGKSEDEVVGKKCYELMHKQHRPWVNCPLALTKKDGQSHTEEVDDPSLGKVLLVTTSPIHDKFGKIVGVAHIAKDITERKKTEEKIINLAKFPEENPNPVLRVDEKGVLLYANPSSRALINHWKIDLGQLIPDIWLSATAQSLADGKKMEIEEEYDKKNMLFIIAPIKDKQYVNIYGSDITERKKIDQTKDEFISLASHQLRTPLSSISLSSELLLRGISGKIEKEQKEFLEEINKGAKKMSLLVNNLLNVSRLEMGTFEIGADSLAVSSFAESRLKEIFPLINDKKISLDQNIEKNIPVIIFDENSFGIVLDNFLSNALRYTPSGGRVSVELKKENGNVILKVSDTGCGIPEGLKEKVFEKSFRADNAKKLSSEGAGLGLYMVKSIADLTGSKVWFDSVLEKGTNFYFSIPV